MEGSYPVKRVWCDHQGLKDVKVHCERESHKAFVTQTKTSKQISQFTAASSTSTDLIKAEVMVTNFLIQRNLPVATAGHLGPLFKTIFPDSKITQSYACSATKTAAIINKAMGPHCHQYTVEHCKNHPFSLGIDGSSDTDVKKMNPVTIKLFDMNKLKCVTNHFYDVCHNWW